LFVIVPFFTYIVLAAILTYTLFPVYEFILRRTNRAGLSSAIAIVIAVLLMIIPAVYVVTQLVHQVTGVYNTFQAEQFQSLANYLNNVTRGHLNVWELLNNGVAQLRDSIVGLVPNILGSITDLVLGLFIMFFVMFYGFREGHAFVEYLKQLLP